MSTSNGTIQANAVQRHQGILTAQEAAEYLGLAAISEKPEQARNVLYRFARQGRVRPIKWSKEFLFSKRDLDRFVMEEVEALTVSGSGGKP